MGRFCLWPVWSKANMNNLFCQLVEFSSRSVVTPPALAVKDKMLEKILRKRRFELNTAPVFTQPFKVVSRQNKDRVFSERTKRRAAQLSTVYYRYITDIVTSGELHPTLAKKEIFLNQVTMSPDFSEITVTWIPTGSDEDEIITRLFEDNASKLRSILTGYYITSGSPRIKFIPDRKQATILEVERLIDIADKGHDEEATIDTSHHQQLDAVTKFNFHNDILDLDHSSMLKRISNVRKKTADRTFVATETEGSTYEHNLEEFQSKISKLKLSTKGKVKLSSTHNPGSREAKQLLYDDYIALTARHVPVVPGVSDNETDIVNDEE